MTTQKFYHEDNYLSLLRHPDGERMWITQTDLQVVADLYQKKVHILETGVPEGRLRPEATDLEREGRKVGARWTVLEPNPNMIHVKDFHDALLEEVGDIYLLNSSLSHFDLLVHKNSRLAKKGNLKFIELHPEVIETNENPIIKEIETNHINEKSDDFQKDDITSTDQHESVDKAEEKKKRTLPSSSTRTYTLP